MPFFQNPFAREFQGYWSLGDRQHSLTFAVPGNAGRGPKHVAAWVEPPYNMSSNDADGNSANTLVIRYSLRNEARWATMSINVAAGAASSSAVTAEEIVANLNADTTFNDRFTAHIVKFDSGKSRVMIVSKQDETQITFYVVNGRAEEKLSFNRRAGVAEMPTYFDRHTVESLIGGTVGSEGMVIELDPDANDVDADIIDAAVNAHGISLGYDSSDVSEDWELLRGRSGIFNFQKITVDSSDRITEIIEYPAGAVVGDMARKIAYTYTGAKTKPDQITEIPYVLDTGDLVTP